MMPHVARGLFLSLALAGLLAIPLSRYTENEITPVAEHAMTLASSGRWEIQRLDSAGIPRQYYSRLRGSYYNPVYISMVGLREWEALSHSSEFEYFLSHYQTLTPESARDSATHARHFLAIADWLRSNRIQRTSEGTTFAVWEYRFPWPIYGLKAPWVSGMAQGVAIQVLVRAWRLTGNPAYRDAAIEASRTFAVEVNDGGVTYKDSPDMWWYEEYAAPGAKQPRVLNGMEHALLGLQDLATIGAFPQAQPLVDRGLLSLQNNIDRFDLGWWTSYDLLGTIANHKYELVNVALTADLARRTRNPALVRAAKRWATYDTPFFEREFLRQRPDYVDIAVLALNALAIWIAGLGLFIAGRSLRRHHRPD